MDTVKVLGPGIYKNQNWLDGIKYKRKHSVHKFLLKGVKGLFRLRLWQYTRYGYWIM